MLFRSRRWGFRTRSGSIPFDQVAGVFAEQPIGDSGIPSRRVVLRTVGGSIVPLTTGYRPDVDGEILKASERIRIMVARGETAPPTEIESLIAAHRTIDAIRRLRERDGLSLEDAKRAIDALRR